MSYLVPNVESDPRHELARAVKPECADNWLNAWVSISAGEAYDSFVYELSLDCAPRPDDHQNDISDFVHDLVDIALHDANYPDLSWGPVLEQDSHDFDESEYSFTGDIYTRDTNTFLAICVTTSRECVQSCEDLHADYVVRFD